MSGPKHLWSGDWEHESAAASEDLADRRPKRPDPVPTIVPPPGPRSRRRSPRTRRVLAIGVVAALVLAAGAWAVTSLLGSSGHPASTTAGRPSRPPALNVPSFPPTTTIPTVPPTATAPAATPAPTSALSRPLYWLGMELQTEPPGAAVIETVGAGSPTGLGPGDVIVAINNHPINGTRTIAPAIRGLNSGDVVQVEIGHGSGLYLTDVTLAAPPSLIP